jgi:hypothetical protein
MNPTANEHQKRMLDLIEEQLNGTLTQKQFCKSKQLNFTTFGYWLKKYKKLKSESNNFIPLAIAGKPESGSIRIEIPGGSSIFFPASYAETILRQLLKTGERESHVSR